MTRRCRSRLKSFRPSSASSAFTWWLTAPWVTQRSSAARVKLSWRAAASKALSPLSDGNRRGIGDPDHEENYGTLEKRCFVCNAIPKCDGWLILLSQKVAVDCG